MRAFLIVLLCFATAGAALADSMRCGKWVVSETASLAELLHKCGEPANKEIATEDVFARNATTLGTYKVGESVTERWRYERGTRSLPMLVTIVDGKIQSIERAE